MGWKYDDEAREDPAKLGEARRELLALAEAGDELLRLADEMAEVVARIPRPQHPVSGMDSMVEDARMAVLTTRRKVERAFEGTRERAANPTYLGNRAACKYGRHVPDED